MVKVRTQMAGMELTALLALDPDEKVTEQIITGAYRELRTWAAGENDIRLLVYTERTGGFDSRILREPADVDEAFRHILSEHFSAHIPGGGAQSADPDGILHNLFPFLTGYIRFGRMEDGSPGWMPVET